VAALAELKATKYLLDGEIVIPVDGHLSFDDLLMRLHPAASRVKKLSESKPCMFIVFGLLVDEKGSILVSLPLEEPQAVWKPSPRNFSLRDPLSGFLP
jgi:ATP-dependent DNA ligase